ncbi:Polypeptide N-acetylgalactosaminyltransferase [Aphelenchoides besseyi]|nr:Polypeptide N-acetylgalactosaminyltransferase [Aphelenchoides besseyi]
MSISRKLSECRRWFRHQTIVGILLILGFVTFITYLNTTTDLGSQKNGESIRLPANRESGSWANEELPGESDPRTIMTPDQLGNFEIPMPPKTDEPGDYGEPVRVDGSKAEVQRAMNEFGFNTYVSDMISMNRTIPDVRMSECKYWQYPVDLPTASVVIAFHNEGWSPLLRTVHSVLLRSPNHLIKEVILVDDFSSKEHLKSRLDEYVEKFGGKIKLIRNAEREGLIRTRTIGAKAATGDVVIFLDAHCEVNYNWLPPLLAPIRHNRKVMTVPVIDGIDMNTWEYRRVYGDADRHFRGIFEWGLLYKETEISSEEKKRRKFNSEPFRSPTHAGGLFAIEKKWFEELGYYDPGLQIWGGEQYELSFKVDFLFDVVFKIWQCGGGILFVPCSHVGHVYRNHMPYGFGKLSGKPVISTNMLRVIKTWMDEYDKYYYIREPAAVKREWGDINEQLELRKRLNCKPFSWFMKYVAYDVPKSYPLLPDNDVWGEAKNPTTGKCIDTLGNPVPGIVIRLNKAGQMAQGEWCISPSGKHLMTNHCHKGTVDGPYKYDRSTQQIRDHHRDICLAVSSDVGSTDLHQIACDESDPYQKFVWTEKY